MKKIFTILVAMVATLSVNAWEYENPGFEWSVGADFTSSYLWRGVRCGGAAIQPDVTIGYGGLNLDVWANISPSDNTFQEFAPEVDFTLSYTIAGLTIGATHYYYCDSLTAKCLHSTHTTTKNTHPTKRKYLPNSPSATYSRKYHLPLCGPPM